MKSNRDAQRTDKAHDRVQVKQTMIGQGVFAHRLFKTDSVIGEIKGHIMDADFESHYCIDLDGKAGMEPVAPFRFLNHSCEPNCEIVLWKRRKDGGKTVPRVWLIAIRKIRTGEELTIDYGWPKEVAVPCLCGSKQCRGWVVDPEDVPALQNASS